MKSLLLFRHAKSDRASWTGSDHGRPLNQRGRRTAPLMARHVAALGPKPELALCSTAARARETLDLALPHLDPGLAVEYRRDLYMADPAAIMNAILELPAWAGVVLVVGHNPGLQAAALALAGPGRQENLTRLKTKFPTAALAVLTFESGTWPEIAAGQGELTAFVTPKMLN